MLLMQEMLQYIELGGRKSLQDLSRHFKMNPSTVEAMLSIWVKKNKLIRYDAAESRCSTPTSACSNCEGCDESTNVVYIWPTLE